MEKAFDLESNLAVELKMLFPHSESNDAIPKETFLWQDSRADETGRKTPGGGA
jgi:hypothetical protein